jgi:hypothetical protein
VLELSFVSHGVDTEHNLCGDWNLKKADIEFFAYRHLTLILTTVRYFLSWIRFNYYSTMAQFSYRTSFVAAATTYGIVVYKTQRARARTGAKPAGGIVGQLADENIQYLSTWPQSQTPTSPPLGLQGWTC